MHKEEFSLKINDNSHSIIRIAFSGTHAVGKTTLSSWLYRSIVRVYPYFNYIPEMARDFCIAEIDNLNKDDVLSFNQDMILFRILKEREMEQLSYSFVADRCLLDHYAYGIYHKSRFSLSKKDYKVHPFFPIPSFHNRYDIIFYVNPPFHSFSHEENTNLDSGIHAQNSYFQEIIHAMLVYYHALYTKDIIVTLKEGDLDKRKKEISACLCERFPHLFSPCIFNTTLSPYLSNN